jgi:hypothetical protein
VIERGETRCGNKLKKGTSDREELAEWKGEKGREDEEGEGRKRSPFKSTRSPKIMQKVARSSKNQSRHDLTIVLNLGREPPSFVDKLLRKLDRGRRTAASKRQGGMRERNPAMVLRNEQNRSCNPSGVVESCQARSHSNQRKLVGGTRESEFRERVGGERSDVARRARRRGCERQQPVRLGTQVHSCCR